MSPSIADSIAHTAATAAQREKIGEFFAVARSILGCRARGQTATEFVAQSPRLTAPVAEVINKAGVTVLSTGSASALFQPMQQAFLSSLSSNSALDRLLEMGAVRAPINSTVINVTALIAGSSPAEAAPKPVGRLSFSSSNMTLAKATAFLVCSAELVTLSSATAIFNNLLRDAVVAACNSKLLAALYALTTPIASSGGSAANALTDITALLGAVSLGTNSRPLFILHPDDVKALATKQTNAGTYAFSDLNILAGGSMFGVPVLASAELPTGGALLVDATGLVLSDAGLELDASKQAALQLDDAPANPPTASSVMTSLWQNNEVALRAERIFSYAPPRANSLAALSGVNY
jgi:HK97 family phage major capsid protein